MGAEMKTKRYVVIGEIQRAKGKYRLQLERLDILSLDDLIERSGHFFESAKTSGSVYEGWSVAPL